MVDDEVRNPDLTEEQLRAEHGGWLDGNPFFLLIIPDGQEAIQIDLGERGWVAKHSESGVLRAPGRWHLVAKEGQRILGVMEVLDGEQPYYVARHVGFATSGANTETVAYGIGKKRLDGHVDRLWFMANGCVTLGDDLEPIAIDLLKRGFL